jgi:C_GCAxxG_C_C family probable redox protein
MCGAVTGGVLALNLAYGRDSVDIAVDDNYKVVQQFINDFKQAFGSIQCPDLIGCDLGTPQGQTRFKENHLREKCHKLTEGATRLALTAIEQARGV